MVWSYEAPPKYRCSSVYMFGCLISGVQPTLLKILLNGRPRSLANDHVILDEVATEPMVEETAIVITIDVMAVVPGVDLVA